MLAPDDVVAAAATAQAALRPVIGRDWSVRAGTLDWDVEQTITHMIGATAKYTLYLASRCEHFIGLSVTRWAGRDRRGGHRLPRAGGHGTRGRRCGHSDRRAGLCLGDRRRSGHRRRAAGRRRPAGGCGTGRGGELLGRRLPGPRRGQANGDQGALDRSLAGWEGIDARFEWACTLLLMDGRADEGRAELATLGCPPPA